MLIAEELLLLCLDPGTGRFKVANDRLTPALAGALLADLELLGRISVTAEATGWSALTQPRRVSVIDGRPTGDLELDRALSTLAEERGRVYQRVVPLAPARLGRRGRGDLLAGVVDDLEDVTQAQVRVVVPMV